MKNKPKIENDKQKKEVNIDFSYIDRKTAFPCRNCRKNDACIIKPRNGKCLGFDEGKSWSQIYEDSLPNNEIIQDEYNSKE